MQLETFNGKYKYFSDKPKIMYRGGMTGLIFRNVHFYIYKRLE